MAGKRARIYPRECIDEVYKVLTTYKKILIPFFISFLISLLFLGIDHVFRTYYYIDMLLDGKGFLTILIIMGSSLIEYIIILLIVPSYLLMYKAAIRKRELTFGKAFRKGLKYYPRLLGAKFIVASISFLISGIILNFIINIIMNPIIKELEEDVIRELLVSGAFAFPTTFLSLLYGVLFIMVTASIVLGRKGIFKGIGESVKIGIKHYIPLFMLLYFFTMFPFVLTYIFHSIHNFYDIGDLLIIPKLVLTPVIAIFGIFSTLIYASFYLKEKQNNNIQARERR